MNVAQHHGPFFDQCVKGNAFDLMMEYYGLFDPRDDQMDGGRIANAFISRMSREMRDGENNGFNLNASSTSISGKERKHTKHRNNNAFYFEFVKQAFDNSLTKNEYTVSAFLKSVRESTSIERREESFRGHEE